MKKLSLLIVVCAITAFCLPAAAAEKLEFGVDLPVNSKYMWRGLELNEDPVFQPDVWVKYGGFSLTVWGGMELTGVHNGDRSVTTRGRRERRKTYNDGENGDTGDFTEVDYILKYEREVNDFKFGLGYIYYDYPHTTYPQTYEIFASIGYNCFLSPTLTVYRDFKEADGVYASFGISHELPITSFMSLAMSGTVGFSSRKDSEFFYGESTNSFSDSLITAALKFPITKNITIVPSVSYTALLGPMRGEHINKRDDTFWSGINVEVSILPPSFFVPVGCFNG